MAHRTHDNSGLGLSGRRERPDDIPSKVKDRLNLRRKLLAHLTQAAKLHPSIWPILATTVISLAVLLGAWFWLPSGIPFYVRFAITTVLAAGCLFWIAGRNEQGAKSNLGAALLVAFAVLAVQSNVEEEQRRLTERQEEIASANEEHRKQIADRQSLQLTIGLQKDLSGIDLAGKDLSGFYLQGKNLSDANLQGAKLRGTNLRGANLRRTNLEQADLTNADLSSIDFTEANLNRAVLAGAMFSRDANYPPEIGKSTFTKAVLTNVIFGEAALSALDFRGADFTGTVLREANLTYADLRGAHLSGADLGGARLGLADLRGADLHGMDLRDTEMGSADMRGTNLDGANLRGLKHWYIPADLRGADLQNSDLREADLSYAKLDIAYFIVHCDHRAFTCSHAANFWKAQIDGTQWPEGFDVETATSDMVERDMENSPLKRSQSRR